MGREGEKTPSFDGQFPVKKGINSRLAPHYFRSNSEEKEPRFDDARKKSGSDATIWELMSLIWKKQFGEGKNA